jgi:Neutral/alkaline non-lysosomal ceramidase, N-terminal
MTPTLALGTAKVDITPTWPVPLAGFEGRVGKYRGVSLPLHARILFFEQRSDAGKTQSALLVSADLIWWGPELVESLRRHLAKRWGIEAPFFILHATHTHSGPQTTHRFSPALGEADPGYLTWLEERLLQGIALATANVEPVVAERGKGACRFSIHRRKPVAGKIEMAPDPDGPADPEVHVVRFRTKANQTKALLVHFTCHPTTTDEPLVSSEYPGAAMALLESSLDSGAVAAFLQGCCGDVRPALVKEGRFYRGGERDVRQLGKLLAEEVTWVLNQPMETLAPCRLIGRMTHVPLPFQSLLFRNELARDEPRHHLPPIPLEMSWLKLCEGLSLLTMNAEMVVEYGLFIKQRFAGSVLPVPYSNGMIGYVPTQRQVAEGGYEARESIVYFCLPAPFEATVETAIHEAIYRLIDQ